MSIENFASTLAKDIYQVVNSEVKEVAEKALIDAINKTVYLQRKSYRPTYNLRDAVTVTEPKIVGGNKIVFSVYINASGLRPEIRAGELNAHADVHGRPFQEGLVEVLNDGTKTRNSIYEHPAHNFFEKAHDDMDKKLIVVMARALKGKGYNVTIY